MFPGKQFAPLFSLLVQIQGHGRRNILGICPRSGTCPGSSPSCSSPLPSKARAHRTIVFCTGSSTSWILPPPDTRINDRNSEKAGYRILVLYIFFPFLSFSFFSPPFSFICHFLSSFSFFFLFLPLPPLTPLRISPTLTLDQRCRQDNGPVCDPPI